MFHKSRHHIEVSSVALVDLKAEISRRQIEVKQRIEKHPDGCNVIRTNTSRTTNKFSKDKQSHQEARNAKELAKLKSEKPSLINKEEYVEWERSRRSLEAKAKLYEALKAAALSDQNSLSTNRFNSKIDDNSDILIDFDQKVREDLVQNNGSNSSDDNIDDQDNGNTYDSVFSDDESESYTDKHGMKRFCMRRDVETYQSGNSSFQPQKNKDLTYAHLREGEIRDHGVGFYAFSQDVERREAEMNRLQELHRATEEGRVRAQTIRAKRDAKMGQRLARLRARKGLPDVATAAAQCLGDAPSVPHTPHTPVGADAQSDIRLGRDDLDVASMLRRLRDEAEKRQATTIHQPNVLSMVNNSHTNNDPIKHTLADVFEFQTGISHSGRKHREWDLGKSMISAQRYTQLERAKRVSDFAPPSHY